MARKTKLDWRESIQRSVYAAINSLEGAAFEVSELNANWSGDMEDELTNIVDDIYEVINRYRPALMRYKRAKEVKRGSR